MTVRSYRGDSVAVAKIQQLTPTAVIPGQIFGVSCNGKSVSYTALKRDGLQDIVNNLATLIQNAASSIPEFSEFVASVSTDGLSIILTAATAGVPYDISLFSSGGATVSETTRGASGTNEVHKLSLIGSYSGGTFTLTYNFGAGNVTTSAIAYNATAAQVQTALQALAGVGAGQVNVVGGPGPASPWYIYWTGSLGAQVITPGTVNGSSLSGGSTVTITEQQPGNGLSDEIQLLDCSPALFPGSNATFTLALDGQTTASLSTASTAAQIQTALQALPNIGSGNVLVYALSVCGYNTAFPWQFVIHFTGKLAATNVSQLVVGNFAILNPSSASPVLTTLQDGGQTSSDDFQIVDFAWGNTNPTTIIGDFSTFTVSYGGQTTAPISNKSYQANAGIGQFPIIYNPWNALQTALQGLSSIGTGNAIVYAPAIIDYVNTEAIGTFLVRLTGAKANTIGGNFTTSGLLGMGFTPTVTRISIGQANRNEIQQIVVAATGGTFTLTAGAQTTLAIAFNASTGTLQTRIQTDLSNTITACTVSGSGTPASPYVVTITSPANTPIALLTANAALLTGGAGTIIELTAGAAGTNEVQVVSTSVGTTGGTLAITFNGATTGPIAYNASAATVQTALRALNTINTVTVSGSAGGPWTVTWSGTQGNAAQQLLIADGSLFTGSSALFTLATLVFSSGPLHYNDPNNWSPAGVPNAGDPVYFPQGSSSCLYGLDQLATFTVNTGTNVCTWTSKSGLINGQGVYVTAATTLPSPLAANTIYYLVNVNRDAGTFQLASTVGGTPIVLTTTGTGTLTVGARVNYLEFNSKYTGSVGLPFQNANGYVEYRPRYLHVGLQSQANGGTQQIVIGTGDGSGSAKIQLNTDIDPVALRIIESGGSTDAGVNAIVWIGTNAANTVNLINGDFGSALFPGEVSNIASLTQRAGSINLGAGCAVGTIDKTGGQFTSDGATINGVVIQR